MADLADSASVQATFVGAILGLLLWSIGAPGDADGNAFGLAAVCAVAFPPAFFFRAYFTVPLTAILTFVTTVLVLGYSCPWPARRAQHAC